MTNTINTTEEKLRSIVQAVASEPASGYADISVKLDTLRFGHLVRDVDTGSYFLFASDASGQNRDAIEIPDRYLQDSDLAELVKIADRDYKQKLNWNGRRDASLAVRTKGTGAVRYYGESAEDIPAKKPLSWMDKLGIYIKEIRKELGSNRLGGKDARIWKIKEGASHATYLIRKEMRNRAATLVESNFDYAGRHSRYSNSPENDYRVAIEVPIKNGSGDVKYVFGEDENGKKVVAAFPAGLHTYVAGIAAESCGIKMNKICGGGRLRMEREGKSTKVTLYGASRDFGQTDHKQVAALLNRTGLEAVAEEIK